ncbi:TPA: UDP-N-acetylenolpyruvoylglucosamine reductase [Candidatus Dependentiae bacterium]|nr:MAG: UDP-N-acetylenolpyruvoylglucosamine reductase [candidate division TM6 bacterium GW2011_GWE2_31_21]KKP53557.1 MAG: UDP-N-acetylenolpyruvoylglucosamine reductase [candidate division TM6 bacterium GW2011_GWF2_33_332]HBS48202.1 UDP-N-acetylenolpyruvoylglucosamine reductase [Candidatus Dependentiae bacterium]HBZ73628.1 UDP-N-acetylenolpyruvoylglucosamine reductase [Candidatus Dependentiae bacterium]
MEILKNIPLHDKNWFQTGGPAKFFCEPQNENDFSKAVKFAAENNLKIFVLGEGANILISDNGFDGLVIHPKLSNITILEQKNLAAFGLNTKIDEQKKLVTAGAGVKIQDLINFTLENNLVGLEEFSGIPGTVGGSTYINIHFIDYFLSDFLVAGQIIEKDSGQTIWVDKNWFEFGYDQSKLQSGQYFLINAIFALNEVSPLQAAYCKGRSDETIRQRNRRYPTSNTCGSFFRNFHADEVKIEINAKKMIFVAYYLDKLGIKGELKVGNAIVSPKHANMIESLRGATSSDIVNLAVKMQEMVYKTYGIIPHAECVLVGFEKYPFLK